MSYEELNSMNHEDLIKYAIELQDKVETIKSDKEFWMNKLNNLVEKYNSVAGLIHSIDNLLHHG